MTNFPPTIAAIGWIVPLACLLTTAAAADTPDSPPELRKRIRYAEPHRLATLLDEEINESSGIAVSRRHQDVFWTHNDSGHEPRLYAINRQGRTLASMLIDGATAIDWEDMASFVSDGRSYLLVADVGDNGRRRESYTIYILEEPNLDARVAAPRHTIEFTYEQGSYDCEAVGVDVQSGTILLVTKVAGLSCPVFRLPLKTGVGNSSLKAEKIGVLNLLLATAMDVSPDGSRALVGTYLDGYEYHRQASESWAAAFERPPRRIVFPERRQGEAACYGLDGETIFLTSEKLPTPLWELRPIAARAGEEDK